MGEMAARKSLVAPKQIPRQKPKSGKFWKEERSAFRSLKKDKGQRLSFDQRLAMKEEEMRKKIEENKAKKMENERKAEQFQVIKNPAKIKRMKKKQLRQLEKRDILAAK